MFSDRVSQTFNLGLEVLTGCGFSCVGCTVDKSIAPLDISDADADAMVAMLEDLKQNDFRLLELKIGPTDITTADNGLAVLEHPIIKKIASYYKVIAINMAMMNDHNLVEIAERLDELAPGKYINVGVPITLKNACNEKWMGILKQRMAYFRSLLKKAKFTRIYVTINIEHDNLVLFSDESYTTIRNMDFGEGFEKVIEFPFVHVRKGFENILVAEAFKRDLKHFADFVKTKIGTYEAVPLIPGHKEGFEYTYRSGAIYSTIVLVENLTIFKDDFMLPKPWTAQAVVDDRENSYHRILTEFSDHPQCGTCCFFDNCARCDVQRLMEETNSDTCLIEMHNRWDLAIYEGESHK